MPASLFKSCVPRSLLEPNPSTELAVSFRILEKRSYRLPQIALCAGGDSIYTSIVATIASWSFTWDYCEGSQNQHLHLRRSCGPSNHLSQDWFTGPVVLQLQGGPNKNRHVMWIWIRCKQQRCFSFSYTGSRGSALLSIAVRNLVQVNNEVNLQQEAT